MNGNTIVDEWENGVYRECFIEQISAALKATQASSVIVILDDEPGDKGSYLSMSTSGVKIPRRKVAEILERHLEEVRLLADEPGRSGLKVIEGGKEDVDN